MAVVIRFVGVALPLSGALAVLSSAFQALKDARSYVLLSHVLVPGIRLAGIILAGLLGWTLSGVLGLYVVAFVASVLIALPLLKRRSVSLTRFSPSAAADLAGLVRFSSPLVVSSLFGLAVWQVDLILLQRLAGAAQAGLYASAGAVGRLLLIGTSAFAFMIAPFMAQQYAAKRLQDMQRLYGRCVGMSFAIGLPFAAALAVLAPQLVRLLFGGAYGEASSLLRILSVGYFGHSIAGPSGETLVMLGRSRLYAVDIVVAALVAVFLYAVLIPRYAATGAAIAAVVSLLLLDGVFSVQLFRLSGINPLRWIRGRLLVAASVASMLAVLVSRLPLAATSQWLALSAALVALFTIYAALAFVFRSIQPGEVLALRDLLLRRRTTDRENEE
jgi:O-antigen/teichoic acid export membrane protein